ncbi:MAG: hypothetical protein A4E29_00458 [Methanomassiliicoccales archaeon PtaB.Bin134]|nr:MAG: hypothetical protein A4E29_00458 [Methanomassiliicoccales archaeon PtaB.Bin134]
MKVTDRSLIGMLLGWLIIFEGFFALSISSSATVEGIGGIKASTFELAAIQLILLGLFISASWALKLAFPQLERPMAMRIMNAMTYLAMATVMAEGIAVALLAGDVSVEGFGGVGKKWIVLVGAQLFAVGVMSLRLWRLRNTRSDNWVVELLGSSVATLIMLEGLTAVGIAGTTRVIGVTGFQESTISTGGWLLFALGALAFLPWWLNQDPWIGPRTKRYLSDNITLLLMSIIGALIMAGTALATTMAGPVAVEGAGSVIKIVVVAGLAQLFALGALLPVMWALRNERLDRHFIPSFLAPAAMVMLAAEGVFAMALSANTRIDGIGWIMQSTFWLAGAQLAIVSLAGLSAWLLKGISLLGPRLRSVFSWMSIGAMALIALEGLAVTILATNLLVEGFSSVRETYILIVGAQMVILALLSLACLPRGRGSSRRLLMAGTGAAGFFILMLPLAILL